MFIDRDTSLRLYEHMYLVRESERAIQQFYHEDEMKTPMHMSMGEEAAVAGVCDALSLTDQVFGTYRSHALYLIKTQDTDGFFCEMYGKGNGTASGKAGSMHLSNPNFGHMGSSAIVSTMIPVSVGAAWANKQQGRNGHVAVFFGDGAIEEGVFFESLNFASLSRIPVIFVCLDNGLAVHTSSAIRRGFSINDIVSHFNCRVHNTQSTDVEQILELSQIALNDAMEASRPQFLHLHYYRYLEHVGIGCDFNAGYRSEIEYQDWLKRDPLITQRDRSVHLLGEKIVCETEKKIKSKIHSSVALAKASDFSDPTDIYKGVYFEQ